MTPRELIDWCEQEAREADQFHPAKVGANVAAAYRRCARELRAALEEKPLAKHWRKEAKERRRIWGDKDQCANYLDDCADDLDAQHDQDRELLREAVEELMAQHDPEDSLELANRIRKHLGGDSDEA